LAQSAGQSGHVPALIKNQNRQQKEFALVRAVELLDEGIAVSLNRSLMAAIISSKERRRPQAGRLHLMPLRRDPGDERPPAIGATIRGLRALTFSSDVWAYGIASEHPCASTTINAPLA
jgi:hypothetical protein